MSNLSNWLAKQKPKANTLQKISSQTEFPLSTGQRRLWLLQQLYPKNAFYQYAHEYHFSGDLEVAALAESFQKVAEEQEILKVNFVEKEGEVWQKINAEAQIPVEIIDWQDSEEELQQLRQEKTTQLFDLTKDVLLRVTIVKLSKKEHLLWLSMHHIIGDRWSLQVLNESLARHYLQITGNETSIISSPKIQYTDYAHWQEKQPENVADLAYWTKKLEGELPILNLPTDNSRSAQTNFKGECISSQFSATLSTKIQDFCQAQAVTPYVVLLSAYQVLLHRYSNQNDILIGTPFSNRDKTALEKLIGFFNETLVLRGDLSGEISYLELVKQTKKTTQEAFQHKNTPFEKLVETLQPERNGTANPLFQVMFLYNAAQPLPDFGTSLQVKERVLDLGVSKFDLTLFINETTDNLTATFEYSSELFSNKTIERMHGHLEKLLESIVENPNQPISKLAILPGAERQQILIDWNKTAAEIPQNRAIHELFEAQVLANPNRACVTYEGTTLSYQEANDRANKIAKGLLKSGVENGEIIGLHVQRSVDMIVGILAILKAGGGYLPLDPEYPAERIQFMVENAGVRTVLAQEHPQPLKGSRSKLETKSSSKAWDSSPLGVGGEHVKILSFTKAVELGETAEIELPKVKNTQIAYMIYTSGSTGQPKGVPITHANLVHSTAARFHFYEHPSEAFLLLSSYSFDSSVAGIFWILTQGGKLVIPKKRIEQDLEGLGNLIAQEKVTHTLMLPSLYNVLLEHAPTHQLQSLNTIMVAGEACEAKVVKRHFATLPQAKLYNEYGPTEGTVWCTAHEIKAEDGENLIPIGKPIPNVENYVLDKHLQPVPIGVAGELCIAGNGLSKGYWKRKELTEKKFVSVHLFEEKTTRIYRTGDLAKFRADGTIAFLGRIDQQVKIRGYRVELEEIKEAVLLENGIQEALVLIKAEGDLKRLVAYFSSKKDVDIAALRQRMKKQLPNYMIPDAFVSLEEFPRLPNGKINRKQLPAPTATALARSDAFAAPQSEKERLLAAIWGEVLGIEKIARDDNFFEIGGNSILSIRIIAKAREMGLNVTPNLLFEQQTVRDLAQAIEQKEELGQQLRVEDLPLINQRAFPLSYMQEAFLLHHLQENTDDQGFLQLEFTLQGHIDRDLWEQAWALTAELHPVLRTSISWQNQKQAIQEVAAEVDLDWQFLDWQDKSLEEQKAALQAFREEDEAAGLNLAKTPIGRFALMQKKTDEYLFFWTCHHILLDGWSGGIVLKDALAFYEKLQAGETPKIQVLPSYASFLHWQEGQNLAEAKAFWQQRFENYNSPTLFDTIGGQHHFQTIQQTLSENQSTQLRAFAKANHLTLNTLLQGAWAILLGQYFEEKEVVFGTTVSGRMADFPKIERIAGLFMNVLPQRMEWKKDTILNTWLQENQQMSIAANSFDQSNLEQIKQWIDWKNATPLFDALFVFGNFLKDGLQIGNLAVNDFSGGFTSSYPLTIRVNPLDALAFDWRYDGSGFVAEDIVVLQQMWTHILSVFLEKGHKTIGDLEISLSVFSFSKKNPIIAKETQKNTLLTTQSYVAPRNTTELHLTKIWETLFQQHPISINDNFFEIGGKSLLAMQLFSKIENEMETVLPPATLMQHPTIEGLAQQISNKDEPKTWSSIVPLRASGNRTPLFCIHAGGAHVFFYNGLVKNLDEEQPVYAIQPKGLDGKSAYHGTIEEMAKNYIADVKRVQANGPYKLLGTCFSNAVCLEMANQLHAEGKEVEMFIVDSAPAHLIPLEKKKPVRRFLKILTDMDWSMLYRKLRRRALIWKSAVQVKPKSAAEQQLENTINSLNSLYAAYTWKPFAGKITLIRSTQFAILQGKHFHLTQWEALAKGGLEVHVIEGRHLTIFEEPDVIRLGEQLDKCLTKSG